jgi:predicted helicase
VVSYIVRSVDELLRTEFGLADGLADTTTWGEMARRHKDLKIPDGVSPDQDFVQILDPATGTGTFLVEVIDLIHKTMVAKWKAQGHGDKKIDALWNEYVPKHLLTRLHGYELLMAPYAIAHLKIGLKLYETGYRFGSDERARVYLTNALEPASDDNKQMEFKEWIPALAHEAAAVNEIKRHRRFTVVIGNPPYSNFGQLNKNPFILGLLQDFKRGLDEKKINLDDDFIKFVRFSQYLLDLTGAGVFGVITNNVFLDGLTHRNMRGSLLQSFGKLWCLNLHGSTKRLEATPDGSTDENVFDILVGVGISLFARWLNNVNRQVVYADSWGTREMKYAALGRESVSKTKWNAIEPSPPNFFLVRKLTTGSDEYDGFDHLRDVFEVFGNGIGTDRDDLFYGFEREEVAARIRTFYSARRLKKPFTEQYRVQNSSSYPLLSRRAMTRFTESKIQRCLYRPFDSRWLYYDPKLTSRPAYEVMQHLPENLALLVTRQVATTEFRHTFVTSTIIDRDPLSLVTRDLSQEVQSKSVEMSGRRWHLLG